MTAHEAIRILGAIVLGLLMFFAGKHSVEQKQAEADRKAKEKADEIEKQVTATPVDKAREELKQWSGKK